MNKILVLAIAAGGLMLLDSPEAAAHKEVRNVHLPSAYYHVEYRRAKHMPKWLKRNKPFVRWYRHSRLKTDRFVTWNQLFRFYNWERSYAYRNSRDTRFDRRHRAQRLHTNVRRPLYAGNRQHRH